MNDEILEEIDQLKKIVETSDSEVAGLVLGISFKDDTGNINIYGNEFTLYGLVEELKQEVDKKRDSIKLSKLIKDLKDVQAQKLSNRFN